MKAIRGALHLIGESRAAYISLNAIYYGAVILAMILVSFDRSIQKALLDAVGTAFTSGTFAGVGQAYSSGQVLSAVAITFVVNLSLGSLVEITLPSLIIPFSGLLVGLLRATVWGLIFSPSSAQVTGGQLVTGTLIAILLFLEGQGYVLAMFAAYVQGKTFLFPGSVGARGHLQGYWFGLKRSAQIYLLVMLALLVAAVYEALVAILIMPRLT